MNTQPCPKCKETMDEGLASIGGSGYLGYISKKQTGILKTVTQIHQARACPNCGYTEFFLDPMTCREKCDQVK